MPEVLHSKMRRNWQVIEVWLFTKGVFWMLLKGDFFPPNSFSYRGFGNGWYFSKSCFFGLCCLFFLRNFQKDGDKPWPVSFFWCQPRVAWSHPWGGGTFSQENECLEQGGNDRGSGSMVSWQTKTWNWWRMRKIMAHFDQSLKNNFGARGVVVLWVIFVMSHAVFKEVPFLATFVSVSLFFATVSRWKSPWQIIINYHKLQILFFWGTFCFCGANNGRPGWCIFLLNEEPKGPGCLWYIEDYKVIWGF